MQGICDFLYCDKYALPKQVMHQVQTIILNLDIHCTFAKCQGIDDMPFWWSIHLISSHLNTWSIADDIVWVGLGGVVCLGKSVWWALMFQNCEVFPVCSFCFLFALSNVLDTHGGGYYHAFILWQKWILAIWIHKSKMNHLFSNIL